MKRIFILPLCITVMLGTAVNAQNIFPSTGAAGVGTKTPNASSLLEIKSTTKGILIPRMTLAQRNAIPVASSTNGLLIYQTNNTPGFYYYSGSAWTAVAASTTGANTSLSNLAATTAVNKSLLPATNNSIDLGSSSKKWRNAYLAGTLTAMSVTASTSTGNGISGTSTGTNSTSYGVYGSNPNNVGVLGSGFIGTYGLGVQYGMYGYSTDSIGAAGVSTGTSSNSYGVLGYNPNNVGVYGIGYTGVYGQGSRAGVYGVSNSGIGVEGTSDNSIGVYGSSEANYAGYFQGSVYSEGTYQGSDKSLKQNIRDFSSAMDIINKLHPTQYEFRQDGNYKLMNLPAGSHYGLIAQDVEKVLPNLIKQTTFNPAMSIPPKKRGTDEKHNTGGKTKSDTISFKALNYTEFIPIVIKGMQELSAKNDEKDKLISDLQSQINELKQMIIKAAPNNVSLSSASLEQNVPNPFNNTTSIAYMLPQKFTSAQIMITDKTGKTLLVKDISGSGKGSLNVGAATLASGAYNYSLLADGKLIGTKQMVLSR